VVFRVVDLQAYFFEGAEVFLYDFELVLLFVFSAVAKYCLFELVVDVIFADEDLHAILV
jgi:hypothetical protein